MIGRTSYRIKADTFRHEAYELIENIENMDTSARTAYYAEIAKEFNGSAINDCGR